VPGGLKGAGQASAPVVGGAVPAYLKFMSKVLPETVPETAAPSMGSRPILAMSALVALALAGTVLLWAHYGTTVFFETIRAGLSACFG
jgi:hypothetical protein